MATTIPARAARLAPLGALVVLALSATGAAAHPLGNFTINHYTRLEVSADAIRIRYVLDLAEIPSVQEARQADTDGNGVVSAAEWEAYKQRKVEEIRQQLDLLLDGRQLHLRPTDAVVSQPSGQGDIPLVRLETWFQADTQLAPGSQHQATFRDRSDPSRLGWREIVIQSGQGVAVDTSNVPSQDVTDELRSYPDDLLQNPLDRRDASWSFRLNASTAAPVAPPTPAGNGRPTDAFTDLVSAADLSPTAVLLALLGAAVLGGIHAASPGHGKSIMAAYIVGTRGTAAHALVLALSVTIAHTAGVLVLGLATVLASNLIFPEQLYPWLTFVSGAIVVVVGLRFGIVALRRKTGESHQHEHGHTHDHEHGHAHSHPHAHTDAPIPASLRPTWRGLFALGLAGGIVPSGSALVVLLSSVALGRLGFGLVLIVTFGLGMAVVLVATGLLLVHAGRFMARLFPDDEHASPIRKRLVAAIPLASASLMTMLGGVATFEGLSQLGLLTH